MSLFYIGAFPPGWGGVTIKNRDLYEALLTENVDIKKIDLHKITRQKKISEAVRLLGAVLGRKNKYVVGISTAMRKRFTKVLYKVNRKAMRESIMVVMGGTAAKDMASDPEFMHWALEYKRIYVETDGMMKSLQENGITNIALYPNCRHKSLKPLHGRTQVGRLKCVFFSYIQPEKGVDIILEAAEKMPGIDFVFYGNPAPEYKETFLSEVQRLPNCIYKGIFKGDNEAVYDELRQYDVLLFPTRWDTEGVPGILVEAKIAGLACVVSDKSYNAELVRDGQEGIVMTENDEKHLTDAVRKLDEDRNLLNKLQVGSFKSADRFYIESYIDQIVGELIQE